MVVRHETWAKWFEYSLVYGGLSKQKWDSLLVGLSSICPAHVGAGGCTIIERGLDTGQEEKKKCFLSTQLAEW